MTVWLTLVKVFSTYDIVTHYSEALQYLGHCDQLKWSSPVLMTVWPTIVKVYSSYDSVTHFSEALQYVWQCDPL